jgi:hypothetical protein
VTRGPVDPRSTETLAAEYETLRTAALGAALAPDARSGLALFLRRGLWGWARARTVTSAAPPPSRAASSVVAAPHQRRAVIHLFAALALNSNHGRAR